MDTCYAKKKNGEICNTNLNEKNKHEIKIDNKTFFVCGRHKNVKSITDIEIIDEITNNVDKMNLNNENDNKIYDMDIKKPCLQHILYLISKNEEDICQYGKKCEFAHNVNIVYT